MKRVGAGYLTIAVGKAGFRIKLPRAAFEAVMAHRQTHIGTLRIAATRTNEPLEGSVGEVVRHVTGSNLACGNYVAALLEHTGLVRYLMKNRQTHVALT